ncbi:MAG: phytanoyl-CoA dioxygenase family protein [Proteobacteria bacterium]|nr:phytanoyl-CoA dioxygenase family protein [Pseudomonadota bacterium]
MPDLSITDAVVSQAEIQFFKENGFLVKPRMLSDQILDPAMDLIWAHLLHHVPMDTTSGWTLKRNDPATWINPQWALMPAHPTEGEFLGRHPIEHYGRIIKLHDLGRADYVLDLLPRNKAVRTVAELLLHTDLRATTQTRGVYAVFPTRNPADPEGTRRLTGASLAPHTDQVCQQLNACAYLQDVGPRSGGFTLYPGSHKQMFQAHVWEANWSPRPTYFDTVEQIVEKTEPLEIIAPKGSVIFWHGRALHSVGIHLSDRIRWALFADFTQNRPVRNDQEHKDVGQYEWFKDAKLFREDFPTGPDMWQHWRLGR